MLNYLNRYSKYQALYVVSYGTRYSSNLSHYILCSGSLNCTDVIQVLILLLNLKRWSLFQNELDCLKFTIIKSKRLLLSNVNPYSRKHMLISFASMVPVSLYTICIVYLLLLKTAIY